MNKLEFILKDLKENKKGEMVLMFGFGEISSDLKKELVEIAEDLSKTEEKSIPETLEFPDSLKIEDMVGVELYNYDSIYIMNINDPDILKKIMKSYKYHKPFTLLKLIPEIDEIMYIWGGNLLDSKIDNIDKTLLGFVDEVTLKDSCVAGRFINGIITEDDIEYVGALSSEEVVDKTCDVFVRTMKETGKDLIVKKITNYKGEGLGKLASALLDKFFE